MAPLYHPEIEIDHSVKSLLTHSEEIDKQADKEALRSTLSYFCVADLRPFSVVDRIGFQKLPQQFTTIGHKYVNVSASIILSSRTTVAETSRSEVTTDHKLLVKTVNEYIRQHGMVGVSTDMWQDDYKTKNYVAVTVHMMESDWNVAVFYR